MATIEDLKTEMNKLSARQERLLKDFAKQNLREEHLLEVRDAIEDEMKTLEKMYMKESTQKMLDFGLGSFMIAYAITSFLVWCYQ